ncbi:hypothetical protein [Salinibius halmophilus]|uniref:hypothetical protein n=1 Tax=Salinibius halmophilus TaxID=1853216 RepID=UPI001314A1BD|nr:hypothetical protein [Salinibius halmophilus]
MTPQTFPRYLFVLALGLSLASLSAAHVRWFVDEHNANALPFEPYTLTEPAVLVWLVLATFMVGLSIFLDAKLPNPPLVDSKARQVIIALLRVFTGLSFVLTSYSGCLIAPHYHAYGVLGWLLVILQLIVGLMLIANWKVFHAGMLMLVMLMGAKVQFGVLATIEYWNAL